MYDQYLCKESDNPAILELSATLVSRGYTEAESYCVAENGGTFFRISCPISEQGEDYPWSLYIDVESDGEYCLCTFFSHSHFATAEEVADQLDMMIEGKLAEVGLALPNMGVRASFFVDNTGDPEKNVSVVAENAQAIYDLMLSVCTEAFYGSLHRYYEKSTPLSKDRNIHITRIGDLESDYVGENDAPYMTSCVVGAFPEVYFIG